MPGIVYNFVKKYDDRFICAAVKYRSVNYLETATGNTLKIIVDDINNFESFAEEHGLKTEYSKEEEAEALDRMIRIYKSRARCGEIDRLAFKIALKNLQIGDGYVDLKRCYKSGLVEAEHRYWRYVLRLTNEDPEDVE